MTSMYAAPATLEEALALLEEDSGRMLIAGGTDLVPGVRAGRLAPSGLIDLRRIPLSGISRDGDCVRIGARATFTDILRSGLLAEHCPALVQAASDVGGTPIRNRATIGGNLANASPAADSAPALLIYDAAVVVAGPGGDRRIPLQGFFEGPGRSIMECNEVITAVVMPLPPAPTAASFVKFAPRQAMAISIVSVAVRVSGDGSGGVAECRIALGAVAPTPMRADAAEAMVVSGGLVPDAMAAAATAAAAACSPIDDIRGTAGYRRDMVEVLVRRGLSAAAAELGRRGAND